ncbi:MULTISPECIES: ABC transporter ATP-binding protein [Turicibacter]|uniref:ATP-binding cassette domain-containing protein n=2 Tax=Turicibacter sanguinis TaxID=154288 RepID=A0A173SZW6_9FIRM|nr:MULTISPECIES: ABC transporter ATP-binding protein [Turicibacter]EFF63447.1 ABC transporter, ATP-binding protein [Turicibacter sanguinis PC909]EGC92143.1 ABC transporter, ATP-binding protein [Turicibacter sp. HGF1]MBP3903897.1 ABC transporter ATP-binding protein [Turicibacter sp.]MCU7191137.1 ABC transporter ATP-binding protein [Turicibacter sanguinis]MCU7202723.1 ABC transporter ATP-binding protein [Turicibacter sanguinis]
MSIVKVSNVTKRFNDKLVLDNISFEIEEGEIFGLIGPNGAGKSTLINIMTTLVEATNGSVEIGGYDIVKQPIEAKSLIGLVPQELALMEEMTAYDNLLFFGSLYGLSYKVLKERINEALMATGLMDRKKEKVKKFSGGMKRRLNIAAALMHHPRILIMDEPTVGVDPQSRNHIFEFTKKICKERNTTVIYTSHYMEEIEELCSKVFIMDLGKEIASGSQEQIKSLSGEQTKVILTVGHLSGEIVLKLRGLEGVSLVTEEGNQVTLTINKDFKLTSAIALLESYSSQLQGIRYEEPRLEDVFLWLTGKSLRD